MPFEEQFRPPPGPPHSQQRNASGQFAPPAGPPPSAASGADVQPPEYAPWLAVPDSSLLPPPPMMNHKLSPTANASQHSAYQAEVWCHQNALYPPIRIHTADRIKLQQQAVSFGIPPESFLGVINDHHTGSVLVRTKRHCTDSILITQMPLYFAVHDDPRVTGQPKTIYFEIKVISMKTVSSSESDEVDAGIAIGFVAPPFPPFRLPGWERASLGVHGDDGRKYVDNNGGGQDFTTYFKEGEVVGLGMRFRPSRYTNRKNDVQIFFTREGEMVGGWDLYEERDQDDKGSVSGLEGDRDILGSVGMFGVVEYEARFRKDEWLYRP